MRVHFVAIGGAGMSVIAELMLADGVVVSGSDRQDSAVLQRLARRGATVHVGHDGAHVAGADLVVVSSAIPEGNAEVVAARAAGIEVVHRSVALMRAAAGKDFVAVAGAHGKTTTSAMLAVALRELGQDPSFAIGGAVLSLGSGANAGSGPVFVAEADESDGSFLNYAPQVAVVTNIEPDHLDHYGTAEAFEQAFDAFAERVVPGGQVITCSDDAGARRFTERVRARGIAVRTYGTGVDADVRLTDVQLTPGAATARLVAAEGEFELDLAVPGTHNLLNAAAAWCAGLALGADPAEMISALAAFTGTARRFELRGAAAGVRVVDDYAHNPTKVAAAVRTGRGAAGDGRLIVLFQPHLYSRTAAFAAEFAEALAGADEVILTAIYPAREEPQPGVTSALIGDRLPGAQYVEDHREAARAAAALARDGDLVMTIGAGDVTVLGEVILDLLRERAG
ncbi:UDP-N-acetylmuramate--L-alanine ligase [Ruania halotolerans]|uniref:UDP-N-acetylmuramate--L-alanine ligase n=1 Tax=Ruania halotolerans TaxID=2897773 RepID=UPI001E61255A|nr:UDP-N-acetylmuramate--L-alanine ligase [Ruania halotolerans]UFU05120.1 UDP-N-acetylmuramate--L-alanine ligase [Ruania halotolerans]